MALVCITVCANPSCDALGKAIIRAVVGEGKLTMDLGGYCHDCGDRLTLIWSPEYEGN